MTILEAVLLAAALAALGGTLLFYFNSLKPQRALLQQQLAGLEGEREKLKAQAETRQKELLIEAREDALRFRGEVEQENKDKRAELQRLERKLAQKEETLDEKLSILDDQREALAVQERAAQQHLQEAWDTKERQKAELQKVAGLSAEDARALLMKDVENQARHDLARLVMQIEAEARAEGEKRARSIVSVAIQRIAADHVSETTVSVVPLPSDDVKGRIIGREGRNIRAFETLTGVDVIIDDTPEAVVLSSFDPVRREVARLALTALIMDGRIHPGRIEETVAKAQADVEHCRCAKPVRTRRHGVGASPACTRRSSSCLGRMRYRTSYGQNLLDHSIEVCHIGSSIAAELGRECHRRQAGESPARPWVKWSRTRRCRTPCCRRS